MEKAVVQNFNKISKMAKELLEKLNTIDDQILIPTKSATVNRN